MVGFNVKKEQYLSLLGVIIMLLTFTCCKADQSGNTLNAFTLRMNQLNEDYKMTSTGYIYDPYKKTISKFFTTDKRELLVEFLINDEFKLCRMNIVFDNLSEDNQEEIRFIRHCIIAFTEDESLADKLLSGIDFYKQIYILSDKTHNKKIGDTEILLDVTDSYTVVTVFQSIP